MMPDATRSGQGSGRTIQSVDRALDIIEILALSERSLSLKEIAQRAGLNASTCHHLLATLSDRKFVSRQPNSRGYVVGSRLGFLAESSLRQFSFVDAAMKELRKLNHETRESAHLAVIQGAELAILAELDSNRAVRAGFDKHANRAAAAHATASGKAILAWLPEAEIARVIASGGFAKFTDNTVITIGDLVEELRQVRRNGFAIDMEEFQSGVAGIAAAVRDQNGAVVGSVGVTIPSMRAEGDRFQRVKRQVRECGMKLSADLRNKTGPYNNTITERT